MDRLLRDWEGTPSTPEKSLDPNTPLPRSSKPVTEEQVDQLLQDWEREVGDNKNPPPATKPVQPAANHRPVITEERLSALLEEWEASSGKNQKNPESAEPTEPSQAAPAPAPGRQISAEDLDKLLRDWEGDPDNITARDLDDLLSTWAASQD
jgi:hypothetical protein